MALVIALAATTPTAASAQTSAGCIEVRGVVRNPVGQPIAGVEVDAFGASGHLACADTAFTDAQGRYALAASPSQVNKPLRLTHPLYSHFDGAETWLPGDGNDFTGLWALREEGADFAFMDDRHVLPGGSVTYRVKSAATPTQVKIRGEIRQSTTDWSVPAAFINAFDVRPVPGGPGPDGLHTWEATAVMPTTGSSYDIWFCGTAPTSTSRCDGSPRPPEFRTGDAYGRVRLDSAPPRVYAPQTRPQPFSTVAEGGGLRLLWEDLAGVDPASVTLQIDGSAVPFTAEELSPEDGVMVRYAAAMAPGPHTAVSTAADVLGNGPSRFEWTFTVAASDASAADATLRRQERPVAQGPTETPSTITFTPSVDAGASSWKLSGTSRVGSGLVQRTFALNRIRVTFRNAGSSTVVTVPVSTARVLYNVATVGTSVVPIRADLPRTTIDLPQVTVQVPIQYRNNLSTATLEAATAALGPVETYPGGGGRGFFEESFAGKSVIVSTAVVSCFARGSNSVALCEADQSPTATVSVGGVTHRLLQPIGGPTDAAEERSRPPTCSSADGCSNIDGGAAQWLEHAHPSSRFGCESPTLGGSAVNLCTGATSPGAPSGYASLYANAWVFADATGGFPLAQQNSVRPGSDACPNGEAGTVTGKLYRAVAQAEALDSASNPLVGGTFRSFSDGLSRSAVRLGRITEAAVGSSEAAGPQTVLNQASYLLTAGARFAPLPARLGKYEVLAAGRDAAGQPLAGARTSNLWQADVTASAADSSVPPTAERLQLLTATEFRGFSAGSYALAASLEAQLVFDFTGCSG